MTGRQCTPAALPATAAAAMLSTTPAFCNYFAWSEVTEQVPINTNISSVCEFNTHESNARRKARASAVRQTQGQRRLYSPARSDTTCSKSSPQRAPAALADLLVIFLSFIHSCTRQQGEGGRRKERKKREERRGERGGATFSAISRANTATLEAICIACEAKVKRCSSDATTRTRQMAWTRRMQILCRS